MDGISLLTTIPFDNIRGLTWDREEQVQNGDTLGPASRIWRTEHRGLRMSYNLDSKHLRVRGSLQKFLKGNNYSGFTYREFAESVGSLADVLNCNPVDLTVINSEISATIHHAPIHARLKSLDNMAFLDMVKPGTNKVYGAECLRTLHGAKVYDKTLAEKLSGSIAAVPNNLVQVELLARRKGFYLGNGFKLAFSPTAHDLMKPEIYRNSNKLLVDMTKRIQIDGLIDWAHIIRKHCLSPSAFGKVLTIHDSNTSAFLKENNFQTWKKYKQLYDQVKNDLSADAASTADQFHQAVAEAVELKYDG